MPQHNEVAYPPLRYTRADFTALRAWLQRVPPETALRLYYGEDDIAAKGWQDISRFLTFLEKMRDDLIARLIDANPRLAQALQEARANYAWSKLAIDYLAQAADKQTNPQPHDPLSRWFKPIVTKKLKEVGIETLADLKEWIRRRGPGWHRPIPYLGSGKADRILAWLRAHGETLGKLPEFDKASLSRELPVIAQIRAPAPHLDGSRGANRHPAKPVIDAVNDWQALEAFLYRYRSQEKTYRAYRKEVERFLLWCVRVRNLPLSGVSVTDCEMYKDFLDHIPSSWIGARVRRGQTLWRPFSGQLTQTSKRYAVQVLRMCFEWLVKVRYLAVNPWLAVADPPVEKRLRPIQTEKALTETLWEKLTATGGILDVLCAMSDAEIAARYRMRGKARQLPHARIVRMVRAIILLAGATGMRREEIAYATRDHLSEMPDVPGMWRLEVLGKRARWRTVFLDMRVIEALRAHWIDRSEDFSYPMASLPLIKPVYLPALFDKREKQVGFTPDGIYKIVTTWLRRIATDPNFDLVEEERAALWRGGVHVFRHTFGTLAVARGAPLEVVQKVMGHASLNTTTIYVNSHEIRLAKEMAKVLIQR